jgi:hypothetical protein
MASSDFLQSTHKTNDRVSNGNPEFGSRAGRFGPDFSDAPEDEESDATHRDFIAHCDHRMSISKNLLTRAAESKPPLENQVSVGNGQPQDQAQCQKAKPGLQAETPGKRFFQ